MAKQYELNEQDIDSTIRYLKVVDPEYATPENAIALLEDLHTGFHEMAHDDPRLLEHLQKNLQSKRNS